MERLRKLIDNVDLMILSMLSVRRQIVHQIAIEKSTNGFPVRDLRREKKILSRIRTAAQKQGLNAETVESIYKIIIEDSSRQQEEILNPAAKSNLK